MILIADSGSTKTDWCVAEKGMTVKRVTTQGINPYHQDEATMGRIVFGELMPQIEGIVPEKVAFYGSGCREEKIPVIREILSDAFECVGKEIEVNGDLLGAARALCGNEEGIACILGTGSNSCLYDGDGIVSNISPLGYILGDEGSGAVIGKNVLNEMLKNDALADVRDDFFSMSRMTIGDIIERVYRQPQANRFLASLAPFICKHKDNGIIHRVLIDCFCDFFRKNVCRYGRADLSVGFVGSIAWYFQNELIEASKEADVTVGMILKSPIERLVEYHK